jgi:transposase InsO family protein
MPWITATAMSQRHEFVILASQAGRNFRQLCRRFGISAKTGYKWLRRFTAGGFNGLADRSRRPKTSPRQCPPEVAAKVIAVRQQNPTWCGRKLRRRLQDLGHTEVPAASTCTEVLRRANLLSTQPGERAGPWQRFERAQPNELWQTDFKGDIATQAGTRCHPLTVLDDCSRFNITLEAAANETTVTVKDALNRAFAQYGLPEALLCDNGPPWGGTDGGHTALTVWLLRLGVQVLHGRPYHPQTQGKDERFHRTLNEELLQLHTWRDLEHCRQLFPGYRHKYNCERPHDSLGGDTPVSRYRPSPRSLPDALPPIEYHTSLLVRVVRSNGAISFGGQTWLIGRAFAGLPIGLRPNPARDGHWQLFFAQHRLGAIDLTAQRQPKDVARSIHEPAASDLEPPQSGRGG